MDDNKKEDVKILISPNESFPFDRKLLEYNIFSFKINKQEEEKQTLSSMKSVILFPNRIKKLNKLDTNKNINKNEISLMPAIYYGNYYSAKKGDVVIGIITQKNYEFYKVDILASREAKLNSIDFEGATKNTKPNLSVGDVVFAIINKENKYSNASLTCKTSGNSKGWSSGESTYGELKEGIVYKVNRFHCLKVLENKEFIGRLKEMAKGLKLKIGYNGRVWIKTDNLYDTPKVYKAIIEYLDLPDDQKEVKLNELFNK